MASKSCRICSIEKELTEFPIEKSSKDGLRNECKICTRIKRKEYYEKNKDKILKNRKKNPKI